MTNSNARRNIQYFESEVLENQKPQNLQEFTTVEVSQEALANFESKTCFAIKCTIQNNCSIHILLSMKEEPTTLNYIPVQFFPSFSFRFGIQKTQPLSR